MQAQGCAPMLQRLARAVPPLVLFLAASSNLFPATSDGVVQVDRIIAGGPDDALEVRHLVLRGTNEEIGRALAEIAKERYGVRLTARDPVEVRAQCEFLERNAPSTACAASPRRSASRSRT